MAAQFVPEPEMYLPDGLLDPRVELTTRQVGDLTCAAKDTIQRRLTSKAFPNARRREGDPSRRWLIPIGDLVCAGLLDASQVGDPEEHRRQQDAEEIGVQCKLLRAEKATLRLEIEMLRERLADRAEEVAFLRGQITGGRTAA